MPGQAHAVRVRKAREYESVRGQPGVSFRGQAVGKDGGAVVGEGDEALVEGGVPEGGEEEAVVDVEAVGGVAGGSGDGLGGAGKVEAR